MTIFHVGKRLGLKNELCTVRYVGEVTGKKGQWLGVEWDDPSRGKHNGTFDGRIYFRCRSTSSQCASFLRPDARFDDTKTICQAVGDKYASSDDMSLMAAVRISGKTVEETGYNKIMLRQSKLGSLANVVLDGQLLVGSDDHASGSLNQLCPDTVLVDLGWNLFESLTQVCFALSGLAKLRSLSLEGNRLHSFACGEVFAHITSLNLDHMLLLPEELRSLLSAFPNLQELSASTNLLSLGRTSQTCQLPESLQSLQLNNNGFTNLLSITPWFSPQCSKLTRLGLKNNRIADITGAIEGQSSRGLQFPSCINEIDLSYNAISSWPFIDTIAQFVSGLRHLRVAGNPIYEACTRPSGKTLDHTQVSMIVIARIGQLKSLNFTAIADKDRLNAETFYLSIIAEELSLSPVTDEEEILSRHPRFAELCEEYGPPSVVREDEQMIDPNSIAAHLITCRLYFAAGLDGISLPNKDNPQVLEIPESFSIYSVYGLIARRFELLPSALRLIWETGERDPPDRGMPTYATVVEEWDSEEEEEGPEAEDWVDREVELIRGTRPLGTVVEVKDVLFRAEVSFGTEDVLVSDFLAKRNQQGEDVPVA